MRVHRLAAVLIVLLLACTSVAAAFKIPPPPRTLVSDFADILSPAFESKLESILLEFEQKTANQIAVATFPSLEGDNLEDSSIRIAEAWKPGKIERDNGVLLLVFRDDRAIRIEVGYGLEAVLTDALSQSIIRDDIIPSFRQGQFEEGILAGVTAIAEATEGSDAATVADDDDMVDRIPLGIKVLAFLIIFILLRMIPWPFWLGVGLGSSRGRHYRGGFGGFRGFGGGRFGGGGASGRW